MDRKEMIEKALSDTISVKAIMETISQFDGRFPICFKDDKGNMIPIAPDSINMTTVNILLPNHTHVFDVSAIVINLPS